MRHEASTVLADGASLTMMTRRYRKEAVIRAEDRAIVSRKTPGNLSLFFSFFSRFIWVKEKLTVAGGADARRERGAGALHAHAVPDVGRHDSDRAKTIFLLELTNSPYD